MSDTDQNGNDEEPGRRQCGTMAVHHRLLRQVPEYATKRAESEDRARRAYMSGMVGRSGCTKIPVVVHVVHKTSEQNISDAQIHSQIDVLNEDFRSDNADISSVPGAFSPFVADARVEFELASTDPDGDPTDGITRTETEEDSFSDDDAVKSSSTGGADPWPADQYLNIWVCNLSSYLGYAQFPGGPAATDGVVITYTAFGTTGTATAPFNLGRTATHEVGHWLNLRHIWGDDGNGCSGSDFVPDTPNQAGPNYGKPSFPSVSCSNGPDGDMFMNFMDYVDDDTMVMFTAGQVTRMQAALDADRSSIGTTAPCADKLKFADDPKLKFVDDPKHKFADDPGTLKFADDPGKSPITDPKPPLADPGGGVETDPRIDPVKGPALDKGPMDPGAQPGVGGAPGFGPGGGQPASPFILATPHHSMAWASSHPGAAGSTARSYQQRLARYGQLLQQYAAAERAGRLSAEERQQAERLHTEYQRLVEEYRRLQEQGS